MKVTRIAYSRDLNAGKYGQLVEQARRLGRVRSLVWDRYGSITGVGVSDRRIRDAWMADGTATSCGVLANAGKEGPCGTRWPASGRTGKPRRLRSGA